MKVFVYWNLHKNLWSVKALEGNNRGRVIARLPYVYLTNVTQKVSEKGRQRVIKTKQKNVHAGIVGNFDQKCIVLLTENKKEKLICLLDLVQITYNPYLYEKFVLKEDTNKSWNSAKSVCMFPDRTVYLSEIHY